MPTYEYRCSKGHVFEQFQRMSEPPIASCPKCGAKAERQLSAGTGVLFKGSGFYSTDYRSESYMKAAAAESGAPTPESSSKKSDSGSGAEASKPSAEAPKPSAEASKPNKDSAADS